MGHFDHSNSMSIIIYGRSPWWDFHIAEGVNTIVLNGISVRRSINHYVYFDEIFLTKEILV